MENKNFETNALHSGHDVNKTEGTRAENYINQHLMYLKMLIMLQVYSL